MGTTASSTSPIGQHSSASRPSNLKQPSPPPESASQVVPSSLANPQLRRGTDLIYAPPLVGTSTAPPGSEETTNLTHVPKPRLSSLPISHTDEELLANTTVVMCRTLLEMYPTSGSNNSGGDSRVHISVAHIIMDKVLTYHEVEGLRMSQYIRDLVIDALLASLMADKDRGPFKNNISSSEICAMVVNVKYLVKKSGHILVATDNHHQT